MIQRYENPIFRRIVSRATPHAPDPLFWTVLTLGVVTVVATIWIAIADYPRPVLEVMPYFFSFAASIIALMLLTTFFGVIRREVSNDAHEMLFLTNIPRERVVWGYALGLLWRWRHWFVVYGWLVGMAGWQVSLALYDQYYGVSSYAYLPNRPVTVPPLLTTLSYGAIWGLFGAASIMGLVGIGTMTGFRNDEPVRRILGTGFSLVAITGMNGLLVLLGMAMGGGGVIQMGVVVLAALAVLQIGMRLARRWQYDPRLVWHVYPDVVSRSVFGWMFIGLALLALINENAYWRFVPLYFVATMIASGQLSVRGYVNVGTNLRLTAIWITVGLIYGGLATNLTIVDALPYMGGFGVVYSVAWLGIWRLVGRKWKLTVLPALVTLQVGIIASAIGLLRLMDTRCEDSFVCTNALIVGLIVLGWLSTSLATWGQFRGLTPIMTLGVHVVLVGSVVADFVTLQALEPGDQPHLFLSWWFALAAVTLALRMGMGGIRSAWRLVWPSTYVVQGESGQRPTR